MLGLEVENEDALPKNLPNFKSIQHANMVIQNWNDPIVCPYIQEIGRNINGHFTTMSWEIIAEANEWDVLKVIDFSHASLITYI